MSCNNRKRVNLGELPKGIFPPDDGNAYIYTRGENTYYYQYCVEKRVDWDMASVIPTPIVPLLSDGTPDITKVPTPAADKVVLFESNEELYSLRHDRTYVQLTGFGKVEF